MIFPIRKRVKLKFTFTPSLQIRMTDDVKTIFGDFKQAIGRRRWKINNQIVTENHRQLTTSTYCIFEAYLIIKSL